MDKAEAKRLTHGRECPSGTAKLPRFCGYLLHDLPSTRSLVSLADFLIFHLKLVLLSMMMVVEAVMVAKMQTRMTMPIRISIMQK